MEHPTPSNQPEPQPAEAEREPVSDTRIYVASLSDYNDGRLHGAWLDATAEPDELTEGVTAMLARSPIPGAEEYAIHDYEGFGPLALGEYAAIEHIARLANGIVEHGIAFAHYADQVGDDLEALDQFEDRFQGRWDSMVAYTDELLDSLGLDAGRCTGLPDFVRPYVSIDSAALARDLTSELSVREDADGIYVFDP